MRRSKGPFGDGRTFEQVRCGPGVAPGFASLVQKAIARKRFTLAGQARGGGYVLLVPGRPLSYVIVTDPLSQSEEAPELVIRGAYGARPGEELWEIADEFVARIRNED